MATIEENIKMLKKLYKVATDQDLAKALGVGKSAISAWKSRGSIPARYLSAIEAEQALPFALSPAEMGEEELCALSLALMRLIRNADSVTKSQRAFLEHGWNLSPYLFREYHKSLEEVQERGRKAFEDGSFSGYQSVFNVIVYDEFFQEEGES